MNPALRPQNPLAPWLAFFNLPEYRLNDWLFLLGTLQLFLYLPSGLLHTYLGGATYARDALLIPTNGLFIWYLFYRQGRHIPMISVIPLAIFTFMILPEAFGGGRKGFLILAKWVMLWNAALLFGMHVFWNLTRRHLTVLFGVFMSYIFVESLVGFAEHKGWFYAVDRLAASQDVTESGRRLVRAGHIGEWLRVIGLQRTTFDFASVIGMGLAMSMTAFIQFKNRDFWTFMMRAAFGGLVLWFTYVSIIGGGRAVLVGIATMLTVVGVTLLGWHRIGAYMRLHMVALFLVFLSLIFVDFPSLIETVANIFFRGLPIANVSSVEDREFWWGLSLQAMHDNPLILLIGFRWAEVFSDYVDTIIVYDNQNIFLVYYGGFAMFFAFHAMFVNAIPRLPRLPKGRKVPDFYYAYLLVIAFQYGESFPRESLVLPSAIFLFFLMGMNIGFQEEMRKNPRLAHLVTGLIPALVNGPPPGAAPGAPPGGWDRPDTGWSGASRPPFGPHPGPRPLPMPGVRPPLPR